MATIATKFQTGAAACVIATAAILTPAVAQAEPAAPLPSTGLGSTVLSPTCNPVGSPGCPASSSPAASSPSASGSSAASIAPFAAASSPSIALLSPSGTILQNRLWWFGTPNPTPPTQTTVFQFYPLALIPGFLQPLFGWFGSINFEACIGGLTLRIGPYGTVSGSYSRGCA
jgi:hypothetical protein